MAAKGILLVEDDPGDEALILHALKEVNIASGIAVARDGAEALDYLFGTGKAAGSSTKDRLPQVIFLDLKLPKVDGLEVLRRIREDERTRILPVVILTSSDVEEDMVRAYRLGANSYVRKPVDFDSFLSVVKQLGMYWSVVNKVPSERRSN